MFEQGCVISQPENVHTHFYTRHNIVNLEGVIPLCGKIIKTKNHVLIQWFEITEVTRAPSIAVDKNYRKIYQRKPPPPVYEQQWAPNTIQTIIMICNAKGIPNAIAQKTVRQN